jgi:hypothetical protein
MLIVHVLVSSMEALHMQALRKRIVHMKIDYMQALSLERRGIVKKFAALELDGKMREQMHHMALNHMVDVMIVRLYLYVLHGLHSSYQQMGL